MRRRAHSRSDTDCHASRRRTSGANADAASSSIADARPYQYVHTDGNVAADSYSDPDAYAGADTYFDATPDGHSRADTDSDADSDRYA